MIRVMKQLGLEILTDAEYKALEGKCPHCKKNLTVLWKRGQEWFKNKFPVLELLDYNIRAVCESGDKIFLT